MDKLMSDLEEILRALYESEINVSISWIRDNGIDVELGDPLNGYDASDKVSEEFSARVILQAEEGFRQIVAGCHFEFASSAITKCRPAFQYN